jgi:uncharacterized protein YndB with AHSA1/START domain
MALTREIELNATRAQVWNMISTGPGLSAWFNPTELDPQLGGVGRTDFGGGTVSEGTVQVYEPGERIVFGSERIAHDVGAEPELETEARLEFSIVSSDDDGTSARGGDLLELIGSVVDALRGIQPAGRGPARPGGPRTVLRLRQDGFPEEGQDVYEAGWDVYFHTLTEYFNYFAGMPARSTSALVLPTLERETLFERMVQGLGVDPRASVGDRVTARPEGRDDVITGVIDFKRTGAPLDAVHIRTDTGFLFASADDQCGGMLNTYEYVIRWPELFDRREREARAGRLEREGREWQRSLERWVA